MEFHVFKLPVVVEPGSVAGNYDMVSLFRHVILVQVRTFYRFTLNAWGTLLFLLQTHKQTNYNYHQSSRYTTT